MSTDPTKRILKGNARAVASIMSLIEEGDPRAKAILKNLYLHTGKARVIGVTGSAGTGKSSLINCMIAEYRRRNQTVGVLAVDPSSPFSAGALLGDRVRMHEHFLDAGVFIRSFATRGNRGGLSAAVREAIHVLDAMGKEIIFVETIGVGQDQLEIAALAHMVLVVLNPHMGDEVQGMKAGLTEIADMLIVNKADLSGADETVEQLRALFGDSPCLIVRTSARKNEGIGLLVDSIQKRSADSLGNGSDNQRRLHLCRRELLSLLREKIFAQLTNAIGDDAFEAKVKRVAERKMDPYSAVEQLAKQIGLLR